jgi:glycosyltransferase involved in cell wall biosynthesis
VTVRRILFLITDLEIGGTPTVVRELAVRLRTDAHVEVACLKAPGPVGDQLATAGVEVTAFGATRATQLPGVVRRLRALLRDRQIDTVFSFLVHANAVAAAASIRMRGVRWLQSIQTTQPRPRWHWAVQAAAQIRADRLVVPSRSAAKAAADWAHVPVEKIVVIPNAVDPPADAADRPPSGEGVRVGFIGRFDPVKRIEDLVVAMTLLDDAYSLHLFGDASRDRSVRRLIDASGLNSRVLLHGAVSSPWPALKEIDLLVLPSDAEGFGLVLIESMAAGVPVVATDVPGIRDVVRHDRNGVLVPPRNPRALASAIRRVAADGPLRRRLIAAGLRDVRVRYTWDAVLPHYQELLLI